MSPSRITMKDSSSSCRWPKQKASSPNESCAVRLCTKGGPSPPWERPTTPNQTRARAPGRTHLELGAAVPAVQHCLPHRHLWRHHLVAALLLGPRAHRHHLPASAHAAARCTRKGRVLAGSPKPRGAMGSEQGTPAAVTRPHAPPARGAWQGRARGDRRAVGERRGRKERGGAPCQRPASPPGPR